MKKKKLSKKRRATKDKKVDETINHLQIQQLVNMWRKGLGTSHMAMMLQKRGSMEQFFCQKTDTASEVVIRYDCVIKFYGFDYKDFFNSIF